MSEILEIYGFSGKLGTGKNFLAEKVFLAMLPTKPTLIMALADAIKVDCCVKDGIDFRRVFHEKDDESRRLLQKRGTEEGRDKFGKDFWIKTANTWLNLYADRGIQRFIITDLRFPDEVEWIKSRGGYTFRVNAAQRNMQKLLQESCGNAQFLDEIQNHSSETSLDSYPNFDIYINNDIGMELATFNQLRNFIRNKNLEQAKTHLTIFCDLDDTICECSKYYIDIVKLVVRQLVAKTGILEKNLDSLLKKYIWSFENRYYTLHDFPQSLRKLAEEAYETADIPLDIVIDEIDAVEKLGWSVFDKNYNALKKDSLEIVRKMNEIGKVVIFTLGDHTEQMRKIANLGLLDFPIEIFTHKDANMFRYLMSKYPSQKYVMIGDSLKRDIIPAQEAGIPYLFYINNKALDNNFILKNNTTLHQITELNQFLLNKIHEITGTGS